MRITLGVVAGLLIVASCGGSGSSSGKKDSGAATADTAIIESDATIVASDAGTSADIASSSDTGCVAFTPCGGSLTGTWTIESGCILTEVPTTTTSPCQPSETVVAPAIAGSFAFADGNSYSANLTITSSSKGSYSPACLGLMGTTCSGFNTSLSQPDAATSGSCTSGDSGDCNCLLAYHSTNSDEGSYATSGNTVTMTSGSSGRPTTWDYCVQGNTLRFHRVEGSATAKATFIVVATKQ